MLLQLATFPQIPRADRVVQPAGPQARPVRADVDAGRTVRVALELAHQRLVVQIPHGYVAVAAARKAHLRVGTDGERVAGGRRRRQLRLYPGRRAGQVPDRQVGRFAPDDQRSAVREQLHGADIVVSLLRIITNRPLKGRVC